jgi:hypothetical protein
MLLQRGRKVHLENIQKYGQTKNSKNIRKSLPINALRDTYSDMYRCVQWQGADVAKLIERRRDQAYRKKTTIRWEKGKKSG